jgi:SNF2 family DNA or RNA helicase
MRLVDPALGFKTVFSLYHHEYLGYLVSSHFVELLPGGDLSLVFQSAIHGNLAAFKHALSAEETELIALLDEITPKFIIKKFGGNHREPHEFFSMKFVGEKKELIRDFVQRRMGRILPLLAGKALFTMGNDGYPAHTPIEMLNEKAKILFYFRRKEEFTRYYPIIKLQVETKEGKKEENIEFAGMRGVSIICQNPAWMLINNRLFTFKDPIEGKKLQPFLTKKYILIPREKEPEYYQKFVTQLMEKYRVKAKGFEITEVKGEPSFSLEVNDLKSALSLNLMVNYEGFRFKIDPPGHTKVALRKEGDEYTFFRIHRYEEREEEVVRYMEKINPNATSLTPWQYIPKEDALRWLATHSSYIQEKGIDIEQTDVNNRINLEKPEIHLVTTDAGDWFDIQAMVQIGTFQIPFIRFRPNILRGIREFRLPDNTIAILPDSWFSDFRHLLEISEPNEDESFRIRKYQAPLLNLPSKNSLSEFVDALKQLDEAPDYPPPAGLKAEMRNYQLQGYKWLNWMKDRRMGAILADDMGLGKTLQTLALLLKEKEDGVTTPSLVVMPTSLIHNWQNEASKFAPALRTYIHSGIGRTRDLSTFPHHDLILTTYGIVRQDKELLQQFPFHYMILDESQSIKNPESKTARAVKSLTSRHRLSLTGTPVENTVMDIWSQMAFLNPGLLGNEHFFKRFYVHPIEKENDLARSAKLRRIIYPFILRRKKNQVEKELPERIEKLHYCEMEEKQRTFYDETRSQYRNYLLRLINEGSLKSNKLNILAGLQKLRQIAIHPRMLDAETYDLETSGKYGEVRRLLDQVISNGSKVLIFSQFVKMLQVMKEDLEQRNIRFNYLDGSTRDRQDQVDSFQTNPDIPVFLISLKAGGVGLNLTAADYVFILDPWWNPAVENQAVDRSHRIGQQKTVFFYKFISEDSIEEKILNLQRRKSRLSEDLISAEEDVFKSLDENDLKDLLG